MTVPGFEPGSIGPQPIILTTRLYDQPARLHSCSRMYLENIKDMRDHMGSKKRVTSRVTSESMFRSWDLEVLSLTR